MTTRSPPSALDPYLQLPPETSLILLTGTLGCSANWLTIQIISSALTRQNNETSPDESPSILLISWLRDHSWWKHELRRTTGLKITPQPPLTFLDLFTTETAPFPSPPNLTKTILDSIQSLKTSSNPNSKILLVLDAPDVLLATSSLTSQHLNALLLHLRSQVYATVLSCSADLPLLSAATSTTETTRPTPIEVETAAFLTAQAHVARMVMSVRGLETGAAKDVSGELRVTRGGGGGNEYDDEGDGGYDVKEAELLYLVQRDGNVKVFSRGSDQ